MRILLDTHILVHAARGDVSKAREEILNDPQNSLHYSAISLWEIAKLAELGRIRPEGGARAFLDRIFHHPRYQIENFTPEILAQVTELGSRMHKDPADQLIVATALAMDAKLMTDDRQIEKSKLVRTL
jgi:PIN domain nuclease of toxin-antitoxin system